MQDERTSAPDNTAVRVALWRALRPALGEGVQAGPARSAGVEALAREAGFRGVRHVSAANLSQGYFDGRTDGLRLGSSDELLVATT
jgi:hypothetical protein